MNYQEVLEYLFSSLPMYQRLGAAAYKDNLDNTIAFDEYFGHPHRNFKSVHIAGTNGKGSVSHMLAAVLMKAGYRTGLYTSPHLLDFRERIKINGEMIPESEVVDFVEKHKPIIEKLSPSFFEMSVAMAFDYFARMKVQIAIIETGMGGRLDSTNIINPILTVITNIGLDHTRFLGNSIPEIAAEKAGIMKPGRPVVIGEWHEESHRVFESFAEKNQACLVYADEIYKVNYSMLSPARTKIMHVDAGYKIAYENLITDLQGNYQHKNIPTVLQSLDSLRAEGIIIPEGNVYDGLREVKRLTGLRGRWEEIGYNPLIICDVVHNLDGIKQVVQQIKNTPFRQLHIVWGMVSDKDITAILSQLPLNAEYYFTKANIPRALDENELIRTAAGLGLKGRSFTDVKSAFQAARQNANKDDMIFIGGSTFVVAEAIGFPQNPL